MKADSIKLIVHGTTLGTNAMIKRRRAGGDGQIIEIEHSEGAPFAVLPCSTALNIQHEVATVALPGGRGRPICQKERHLMERASKSSRQAYLLYWNCPAVAGWKPMETIYEPN